MPNEITEVHKRIVNAIWRGLRDLEILDELYRVSDLRLTGSDREETEIESHIYRLRKEVAEARTLAPEAAQRGFRQGMTRQEVEAILKRPHLLSTFEIDGIVSKAEAAVEAAQGGVA